MSEGQSRYGIMEELNNRKINEKEKLANIERETDNKVYNVEKDITQMRQKIQEKEKTYVQEFKDWKREKELRLSMVQTEYERTIDSMKKEIGDREKSYVPDFKKWKEETEKLISDTSNELKRYKEVQEMKIKEKKEIITEIETGISSLKEMSKEHQTKE